MKSSKKRIVARVEELLWWCNTLEAPLVQIRACAAHRPTFTLHRASKRDI